VKSRVHGTEVLAVRRVTENTGKKTPGVVVAQEHLRGSEHAFNAHEHCLSVSVNVVPYRPNLGSGMEEVAGSILTRSTIHLYSRFREQSLCLRVLFS
jgi:hypothetical protein